jgi:hypothetical protein
MTTNKTYYYKKMRGSLVDVICDELTCGEEVYTLSATGKFVPTTAPSLLIDEYNVSTDWDDNGQNFILVQVADEETQRKVVELAKRFGKNSLTKHTNYGDKDKRYQVKILIDEKDFDGAYFDPKVLVRGKKAS